MNNVAAETALHVQETGSLASNCIVCGGLYRASHLPALFECTNCKFVSANLAISDEELAEIYGEDYFHGEEYLDYIKEGESLRLNFRRRLDSLERVFPELSDATVFEVGCAYGFFLKEAEGRVMRASGMDISADAVNYAQNVEQVNAQCGNYLDLKLPESVDVITMWDTIEHLKRPDLFVKKAANDLRKGGCIAITTGDIGSLNARMKGKNWRMIHPPSHLHYFSTKTLSRLLDLAGFDVIHVSHPGNSRRLRSVLYFLTVIKAGRKELYERFQHSSIFNIDVTANLFDIMYVIGRKR